ncbi:uncharacterized protein LOC107018356 [Solanum pennellii]|uniref:Uncharacterized protein LOC107018356 n=1 Tax=Solanum pennellii TaxID=28526 RepID=A0ABM1GQ51_SOLPN|nr:uncharacterized protein LOC107018356 [Solanum pennellii]
MDIVWKSQLVPKQTMDPPMPSEVEIGGTKDVDVIDNEREFDNVTEKVFFVTEKVFMKHIVTKKRSVSFEDDKKLQHRSAIAIVSLVKKKNNHGSFTIPCTIELLYFDKALCDLGASINLIPLSIYKKLGLGDDDVPIKVESYIFLANFVIIRCEDHFEVPIILGRSFLSTGHALVDMEKVKIKERLGVEALEIVIMNFLSDFIEEYDELATTLDRCEYRAKAKKLDLDMKNQEIPLAM